MPGSLRTLLLLYLATCSTPLLAAGEPLRSGPRPGERPKPFSVIAVTGPNRGKTHCYVCETADRPVVIVFARSIGPTVTALIRQLDAALVTHKGAELRSWVVFLTDSPGMLEPKIDQLAREHSVASLPLTLFEGSDGPPSFRIGRDADLTVTFSVKQKTAVTRAFRAGELTEANVTELLADLARILPEKG